MIFERLLEHDKEISHSYLSKNALATFKILKIILETATLTQRTNFIFIIFQKKYGLMRGYEISRQSRTNKS
jgi:hypothetical protein